MILLIRDGASATFSASPNLLTYMEVAYMANKITQKQNEEKFEEVLSLWYQTSKNGKKYLSGKDVNGNKVVAFINENKRNEKQPDIKVYYPADAE